MKTMACIILLNFAFVLAGQAQAKYSKQSLEQLSREELGLYLEKAQKQKKTGAILSIAGPGTAVLGILLASYAYGSGTEGQFFVGLLMMGIGPIATAVGLPVLITGSSRVKRINEIKSTSFHGVSMELAPCIINNYQSHNQHPGVKLRIRF
jgi:hypothetical protein